MRPHVRVRARYDRSYLWITRIEWFCFGGISACLIIDLFHLGR